MNIPVWSLWIQSKTQYVYLCWMLRQMTVPAKLPQVLHMYTYSTVEKINFCLRLHFCTFNCSLCQIFWTDSLHRLFFDSNFVMATSDFSSCSSTSSRYHRSSWKSLKPRNSPFFTPPPLILLLEPSALWDELQPAAKYRDVWVLQKSSRSRCKFKMNFFALCAWENFAKQNRKCSSKFWVDLKVL